MIETAKITTQTVAGLRARTHVLASWRDVTNEREAESGLRQSVQRWHSMADAATDASLIEHVAATALSETFGEQLAD